MQNSNQSPSTVTTGFFQDRPEIGNAFIEDVSLRRAFIMFLPCETRSKIESDFTRLGNVVLSPQVLAWYADGESNPPRLQLRDTYGKPLNRLITCEGYRQLQDLGLREGMVALGYDEQYGHLARVVQFIKLAIWGPSSSTVTCPSAMQDGAAALLRSHLRNRSALDSETLSVFQSAYDHLTSREIGIAWTSGQWMTERVGGSDVGGTETRAYPVSQEGGAPVETHIASDGSELGPWAIDGFKWFSSATDADMTVLLAKTPGSNKLSCFFAPTRMRKRAADMDKVPNNDPRADTEFNGIYPQRLKNKLGTKAMPTAELELKNMRAYMIGKEGQGVKEISTVLTLTRLHNAITAAGALGRGLAVARAYARVRRVASGRLLLDMPAHVRALAYWHTEHRGNLMLAVFLPYCLGISESLDESPFHSELLSSRDQARMLLRLFNPVSKALTALTCVAGLRACMESMGGIGYLENEDPELNIARMFRDANVLPIWEGTTNIMAGDVIRVLRGRDSSAVFSSLKEWIETIANRSSLPLAAVTRELNTLKAAIMREDLAHIVYYGIEYLETLGWIVMTCLLAYDASRDSNTVAIEVTKRWLAKRDKDVARELSSRSWQAHADMDRRLVFSEPSKVINDGIARL